MSFQAYLDAIQEKTGKTAAEFRELAGQRGYLDPGTKAGEIITWLKEDYDLGRGHAMALVASFKTAAEPERRDQDIRLAKIFAGPRAHWRPVFDRLMDDVRRFGPGVASAATDSYVSIVKGEKKFAVVAFTADRMDLGVKVAEGPDRPVRTGRYVEHHGHPPGPDRGRRRGGRRGHGLAPRSVLRGVTGGRFDPPHPKAGPIHALLGYPDRVVRDMGRTSTIALSLPVFSSLIYLYVGKRVMSSPSTSLTRCSAGTDASRSCGISIVFPLDSPRRCLSATRTRPHRSHRT